MVLFLWTKKPKIIPRAKAIKSQIFYFSAAIKTAET